MRPYNQVERNVRDWLAKHLSFIESNLTLIDKEYHLNDTIGATGFIDILCKDVFNNFVIIEIKRESSSSRQTMNEILKYHSLLTHNFRVRESEIRIIIISTNWKELIRAFTLAKKKTTIDIQGYKIEINSSTHIPYSIEKIYPLSESKLERRFAYHQSLDLFTSNKKRNLFQKSLLKRVNKAGIKDFVIVDIDHTRSNKSMMYHFATVTAFQQQTKQQWLAAIKKICKEEDDLTAEDFESDKEYLIYLEDAFIAALNMHEFNDSAEAGFPEKFQRVINNEGWIIQNIQRFGIFKTDPRYTDDLLIKELQGYDGNNRNKYSAFGQSSQKEKLLEICKQSSKSLKSTPQWFKYLNALFLELLHKKESFKLIVDIYNPDSIITSLYFALTKGDPNYFPTYNIVVAYDDSKMVELHLGDIFWNGKKPKGKLFTESSNVDVADEILNLGIDSNNLINSADAGLVYTNKKVLLDKNDKQIENKFLYVDEKGHILLDMTNYRLIENYIINNKQKLEAMLNNYNKHCVVY